ncbi:phosphotransferase [Agrococcus sp. SL85]|uniref:phosphotransferase enzyme family protein n=1 Tax=Agrococcus sp. SL85 TaxID=2995141 RepID=UPI00226C71A6|nr:phosphotransferase [Agrococcus sp. SL85]WAC65089.1 phosphotransferase [Agrococcus sp. SL85]
METPYDDLPEAAQVEALRPAALAAATAFGLEVERLEVVLHGYNTTFAVDGADGVRRALRLGTNSQSTRAHAIAQQAWQRAIAAETEVRVPVPLATPGGEWCVEVDTAALGRPLLVTVSSWLDGPDAERLDPDAARALGRAMAILHEHAATWPLPEGGGLPRFVEPLFGDRDVLAEAPLDAAGRAVLAEARERTGAAFARLHDGAALRPLHADLHGGNLKWHEGRLAIFDFDDAGLGIPALDLAIASFYVRSAEGAPLEAALLAGYAEVAPLPDIASADHEALVAARQILLLNAILVSSTAELRGRAAEYAPLAVRRLDGWLRSGTFARDA